MLWATGSVAFKVGLHSAPPLLLATMRFIGTGIVFAPYLLLKKKYRFWPTAAERKPIVTYGLLNTTLTLGAFATAQKYASAGISMLFIAVTPLVIVLFSAIFLKRRLSPKEYVGILIAFAGIVTTSITSISGAQVKLLGLILLLIYVTSYAISSIYFSSLKLSLSNEVFNIWQVFIGGLAIWPFTFIFNQTSVSHWDINLWGSLAWMIIVLSFIANQLWLYLIKIDTVTAASWLYLVPVLGFVYGYLLLNEPITYWAVLGMFMVISGLIISKQEAFIIRT